jgi:hypothetical protein
VDGLLFVIITHAPLSSSIRTAVMTMFNTAICLRRVPAWALLPIHYDCYVASIYHQASFLVLFLLSHGVPTGKICS